MNIMQELLKARDEGTLNEEQMYWFRTEKEVEELYDVENDPHELNNLAGDPAYREVKERLSGVLDRWIMEIDDKGVKYRTEKELMLSLWPGGIQPETAGPEISFTGRKVSLFCDTEGASMVYQVDHQGIQ